MRIVNRAEPPILSNVVPYIDDKFDAEAEVVHRAPRAPMLFGQSEMAALYQRVRAARPTERGLVLLLVGANPKAGATSIAYGIGRVAAEVSGLRVLLCDATGTEDLLRLNNVVLRRSLGKLAAFEGFAIPPGLVACPLELGRAPAEMLSNIPDYAESLRKFRSVFDLIIVDVPSGKVSDLGPALAKHVDAVVVVVEAERSRAPSIEALMSAIEGSGGSVTGVVFNKRVQHIPAGIYRWL